MNDWGCAIILGTFLLGAFIGSIISYHYAESTRVQSEAVVLELGYYDPEQEGKFRWDMGRIQRLTR